MPLESCAAVVVVVVVVLVELHLTSDRYRQASDSVSWTRCKTPSRNSYWISWPLADTQLKTDALGLPDHFISRMPDPVSM
jgi:hypothetical protein